MFELIVANCRIKNAAILGRPNIWRCCLVVWINVEKTLKEKLASFRKKVVPLWPLFETMVSWPSG